MAMKLWEATVRQPGPGTQEIKVRVGADSAADSTAKQSKPNTVFVNKPQKKVTGRGR